MNFRDLVPLGFLPWQWRAAIAGSLILGLAIWIALGVPGAQAQQLDPLAPMRGYITADPVDPANVGLATPDGRFALQIAECDKAFVCTPYPGCGRIVPGVNVLFYPNMQLPPFLPVTTVDAPYADTLLACGATVKGRMDPTPCFTNDAGVCDVSLESDAD